MLSLTNLFRLLPEKKHFGLQKKKKKVHPNSDKPLYTLLPTICWSTREHLASLVEQESKVCCSFSWDGGNHNPQYWKKRTRTIGGKGPASLGLIHPLSSLSLSVRLFSYLHFYPLLKDLWAPTARPQARPHRWSALCKVVVIPLSRTALLFYGFSPHLTVLCSSTWHSEAFLPLHVSLARGLTHYAAEHCVRSFFEASTKAPQCLMLSNNIRENTTSAFTVSC